MAAEVRWPRIGYRTTRWATAFPVGMYATCSFVTRDVLEVRGVADFARAWVWVAFAVWLCVALGFARRVLAG